MIKKFLKWFRNLLPIVLLIALLSRIKLPGYKEISLYDILKYFFNGLLNANLSLRASAISYNFFVALFPAIIFFFTLIAYLPVDHIDTIILDGLSRVIPSVAFEAVHDTILDIVNRQRGGLLSIGFLIAMFFSTNGIMSIIEAFNTSLRKKEIRSAFTMRLVAFLLTIFIVLMLLTAASLLIFSSALLSKYLHYEILGNSLNYYLISSGRWILFYLILLFTVASLYYWGPGRKVRIKFFSIGAIVTSLLMMLLIIGFSYAISNFGQYNKIYGSIGALLIIMLLINLNAFILLIGFEFNIIVYRLKQIHASRRQNQQTLSLEND